MDYLTKIISFTTYSRSKKKDSYSNLANAASESSPTTFKVDKDALSTGLMGRELMGGMVEVPKGVDINEWMATQTVMLFENINLLCGCLSDYCKPVLCPSMNGPDHVQYTWLDERGKVSKMAACQYIDCITAYIHSCVRDESIFPTKYGNNFPNNFRRVVDNIHRLLCHILVHSYHSHLPHLTTLNLTPHYTTILHHFLSFNRLFHLANPSDLSLFDDVLVHLDSGDGGCSDGGRDNNGDGSGGCGGNENDLTHLNNCENVCNNNGDSNDATSNDDSDTNCDRYTNNTNITNSKFTNNTNTKNPKTTNNKTNEQQCQEPNTNTILKTENDNQDNTVHSYVPLFTIVT